MRKGELSGLTGIRFYAALFVYLYHVTIVPGMEALSGSSLFFNAGDVGVSFFFVLSGFILTYNYADVFNEIRMKRNLRCTDVCALSPAATQSSHAISRLGSRASPRSRCWWTGASPSAAGA